MKTTVRKPPTHQPETPFVRRAVALAVLGLAATPATASSTNVTYKAGLTLRESYDSNVYILDTAPYPGIVPPPDSVVAVPKKGSFVTSVTPELGFNFDFASAFAATVSYAPDLVWYHSASSEDYIAHHGNVNFSGKVHGATYEWKNAFTWIDGNHLTALTLRPGDCRAIGGIPLRNRRDAGIYKGAFRLTIPAGKFFVRPVVNAYAHDFHTALRPNLNPNLYVYENYVDRYDLSGGLDLGYEAFAKTKLIVGYRRGHQGQGVTLNAAGALVQSPYGNDYDRYLLGIEGTPVSWLKLNVLAGPDIRHWGPRTPAGFNRDEMLYYIDGTVSVLPTDRDTFSVRVTRYEQPAFTSQSVYEDVMYTFSYQHRCTDKLTVSLGFVAYLGDWQAPVQREDWIYTPSATVSYAFNKHFTAEASYSYDWAENDVPTNLPGTQYADGREFTRHLVSLALSYKL